MKVGDYVRTDNGIAKCIAIDENNGDYIFDKSIFYEPYGLKTNILYKYYLQDEIDDGMKIKSNIIDLIEVGDYINGLPVRYVEENRVDIGQAEDYLWLKNEHIKSIVTKEQFEAMQYNLESEVN